MSQLILGSICLSDIEKLKIKKGKDGKCYCNIAITELKNADKFGNTHSIYLSQTKEEREEKTDIVWIGKGQVLLPKETSITDIENMPVANENDLPF